MSSIQIKLAS